MPAKAAKPAKAPKAEVVTARVNKELSRELDALARATDRSKSYIVSEAIQGYVDLHRWQVEGVKAAMRDVEAGRFADPAEVAAIFRRAKAPVPGSKQH